jgi:putative aldouronate transport system substrate-binding protein
LQKYFVKGKKTAVTLLSAGLLLSQLAACSGSGGGESASKDGSNPITLTYFSEDGSPNWNNMNDRIGKVITEKTGVVLDAEFAGG